MNAASSQEGAEDRRNALLCALAVAVAVLACVPILETGVNDDWSYSLIARDLARTGHFVYTGWASVMVGAQAVWAALFIKIFGFSYTLVRLTTLPLAMSCAALLYALHRRAGIVPKSAVFGTLALCLSPVFTPLAASFMTDIPGLFFLLLCIYGTVRALEETKASNREKYALRWLLLVSVSGVLGGTVRQIVWVMLPICFGCFIRFVYLSRVVKEGRGLLISAGSLLFLSLFAAITCLWWFQRQPGALSESFAQGLIVVLHGIPRTVIRPVREIALSCSSLLFPVLLCVLPTAWRLLHNRFRPPVLAGIVLAGILITAAGRKSFLTDGLWLGNIFTPWGLLGKGDTTIGSKPWLLPEPVFIGLSTSIYLCLMTVLLAVFVSAKPRRELPSKTHSVLWTMAIFYAPLLLPRFAVGSAFDRYMLPLLVVLSITLLRWRQDQTTDAESPKRLAALMSGMCLALYAFIGVATTHDYMVCLQAEQTAASYLTETRGIPRTAICAGFEYDCITQINEWGYLNDSRIHPASLYQKQGDAVVYPVFGAWRYLMPAINPRYFVVLSPQQKLKTTNLPPVSYSAWLPPEQRQVFIQESP